MEGIFALYDARVRALLDMKIFADADADVCLARRSMCSKRWMHPGLMLSNSQVLRDVRERGRDIEGCIKQWMTFVKPNFQRYVDPQRNAAGT